MREIIFILYKYIENCQCEYDVSFQYNTMCCAHTDAHAIGTEHTLFYNGSSKAKIILIIYEEMDFILFIYKFFLKVYNKCIIKIYKQRLMNS